MEAYQVRVLAEQIELDEKLQKLEAFVNVAVIFGKLPEEEQERLKRQLSYMKEYNAVLRERIEAFLK